ncbi:MAG: Regulatory protein luxR family [Lacunisphaera sp.]|nr:Regulatory protein luxR family [Lacunisphaera sp.]
MVAERYCLLPRRVLSLPGGTRPPDAFTAPKANPSGLSAIGLATAEGQVPPATALLTPAEENVLSYLCAVYSNMEIASFLGKAEPTVKHKVSACLRKFGVSSRMRLMAALR